VAEHLEWEWGWRAWSRVDGVMDLKGQGTCYVAVSRNQGKN
jgi:hypothetical protein